MSQDYTENKSETFFISYSNFFSFTQNDYLFLFFFKIIKYDLVVIENNALTFLHNYVILFLLIIYR